VPSDVSETDGSEAGTQQAIEVATDFS
jgi:hypothetical protein